MYRYQYAMGAFFVPTQSFLCFVWALCHPTPFLLLICQLTVFDCDNECAFIYNEHLFHFISDGKRHKPHKLETRETLSQILGAS